MQYFIIAYVYCILGVQCLLSDASVDVVQESAVSEHIAHNTCIYISNRGMTVEAARQCAKDRKAWRALVHM